MLLVRLPEIALSGDNTCDDEMGTRVFMGGEATEEVEKLVGGLGASKKLPGCSELE